MLEEWGCSLKKDIKEQWIGQVFWNVLFAGFLTYFIACNECHWSLYVEDILFIQMIYFYDFIKLCTVVAGLHLFVLNACSHSKYTVQ